jgi:hypothetical protein
MSGPSRASSSCSTATTERRPTGDAGVTGGPGASLRRLGVGHAHLSALAARHRVRLRRLHHPAVLGAAVVVHRRLGGLVHSRSQGLRGGRILPDRVPDRSAQNDAKRLRRAGARTGVLGVEDHERICADRARKFTVVGVVRCVRSVRSRRARIGRYVCPGRSCANGEHGRTQDLAIENVATATTPSRERGARRLIRSVGGDYLFEGRAAGSFGRHDRCM